MPGRQLTPRALGIATMMNSLQVQNDYLTQQVQFVKFQLEIEIKLRVEMEEKLKLAYDRNAAMITDMQRAAQKERYFYEAASKYAKTFADLMPILKDLELNGPVSDQGYI